MKINDNPSSPIEFFYDGFVYVISIKNKKIVNWSDCAGSVGQLLRIYNKEENLLLEEKINEDLLNETASEETINTIFKILPSGEYNIYQNLIPRYHIVSKMTLTEDEIFMTGYYPFEDDVLVMTQPEIQINQERVEYYKEIIQKGARPKVVTFQVDFPDEFGFYDNTPQFILDGHHKALAYEYLKIEIPVLNFVMNSFPKDRQDDKNQFLIMELIDFLDLDAIFHILYYSPKVIYEDTDRGVQYNRYLDMMLAQSKRFYGKVVNDIMKEYKKDTFLSRDWAVNRIDAILISLERNKKIWVNYRENNENKGCNVSNFKEFDEWVEKLVGIRYTNLGK